MKHFKNARILLVMTGIFWLIETAYFGWNMKPMSDAEGLCDTLVTYGMIWAFLEYMRPLASYYEEKMNEHFKN